MSVNADKLVQIIPRVIDTGTPGLAFNGLFLSQSDLPPLGRVLQFSGAQAVAAYFGDQAVETRLAARYFAGYVNADYLPSMLYIAPYSTSAAGAWLRGGTYEGTLADIRAVSNGSLNISIDGEEKTLAGLDFSGATSFSAAALVLQTALAPAAVPATAGTLAGGVIAAEPTAFHAVTDGALDIAVDGEVVHLTGLNFSAADSLEAVAAVIGTALSGAATVTVRDGDRLLLTSAATGAASSVGYASNPGESPNPTPRRKRIWPGRWD